jgi:hypothetical protein
MLMRVLLLRVMVPEVLSSGRRGARHSGTDGESSTAAAAAVAVGRATWSVGGSTEAVIGVVGGGTEVGT